MNSSTAIKPGSLLAAYLRDSGGERQELSTSQQETEIRAWCDRHGLVLSKIFRDDARPGSGVVGRQGFQDMMHYFRSGCPEAGLVIWSYSRFARDIDDAQFHRADLRRRGYQIVSLTDDVPDGPMGRLFEAAIDWKNEQFLEDLSRDVKRGLRDLVQQYGAVPGTPPRGFIRQPIQIGRRRDGRERIGHRWAPDPELIPRVQRAFELKAAGRSILEIHRETRLFGSLNSYHTLFKNRLFIGELVFGDLVIEDYCPPVIDRSTWDAVQADLQRRASRKHLTGINPGHPRRSNSAYLLSGLAYCARCGAPLAGDSSRQRSGGYYYRYHCTRAKRRRDCDAGRLPLNVLEPAVVESLSDYILTPEGLQACQRQLLAEQADHLAQIEQQQSGLRRELGSLRRQIAHLTNAIAEAGHSRALLSRLTDLEASEARLLADLAGLQAQLNARALELGPGDIEQISAELRRKLLSGSPDQVRQLLQSFVDKVVVDRDGSLVIGMIHYLYPPKVMAPSEGPDTVSLDGLPLGAPLYRHSFQHAFTASIRQYTKRPAI